MRFSVSVPVLSTHRKSMAPSVSTAAARRTRILLCASRQAPIAMNTASTIGNSSGTMAIASVMPDNSPVIQSCRSSP